MGWDVLRRYLRWRGYSVPYVQNFTDIDDKILNRAKSEGTTMAAVSERYIQRYFEDMRRLTVKVLSLLTIFKFNVVVVAKLTK